MSFRFGVCREAYVEFCRVRYRRKTNYEGRPIAPRSSSFAPRVNACRNQSAFPFPSGRNASPETRRIASTSAESCFERVRYHVVANIP